MDKIEIFIFSCIRTMTPILFAALSALIARKGGIDNVGLEGIMMISALMSVIFTHMTGNIVLGLLLTLLLAAIMGLGLSIIIQHFIVNPIVAGTALNIFGGGGTIFIMFLYFGTRGYSANVGQIPDIDLPYIENIPLIGKVISGHSILTYFSFFLIVILYVFYFRSVLGIRFRASGQNSVATLAAGINVFKMKTLSLMISCVVASLGGVYMSMSYMSGFNVNMVSGRGFIGLAVEEISFGNPFVSLITSFMFSAFFTVANYLQGVGISVQIVQAIPYICVIFWMLLSALIRKGVSYKIWTHKE